MRIPLFLFVLASHLLSGQTIWHVQGNGSPGGAGTLGTPFGSIQQAITASSSDDTIRVQPGTYLENLDYLGKKLIIESTQGPLVTIIDGNATGPIVWLHTNEPFGTTISGFGLINAGSSPSNTSGAAVDCTSMASINVTNCIISNNAVGIVCADSWQFQGIPRAHIESSTIDNNGIGVYASSHGAVLLRYCTIEFNDSGVVAAALTGPAFKLSIESSIIRSNTFGITNNDYFDMHLNRVTVSNSIICGNNWGVLTTGSYPNNPAAELKNCTVYGNGVGIHIHAGLVANSIVRGNAMGQVLFSPTVFNTPGRIEASNIESLNLTSAHAPFCSNVDVDPLFVDPANGDFHLMPGSPCIDAGDRTFAVGVDFEGQPRDQGAGPDIGADESVPSCVGACLLGNPPARLGGVLNLRVLSASPLAPLFVFLDTQTGSLPLGTNAIWGHTQIAFSNNMITLASPSPIFPSLTNPFTGADGTWSFSQPLPYEPALLGLQLYGEAYVLDFLAANGFFHQSNLLPISFSLCPSPTNFVANVIPQAFAALNRHAVLADLNGDGHPDLACSSAIYPGTGSNGFGPPIGIDPDGIEVAAADMNGDGHMDLITMDAPTNPYNPSAPDETVIHLGDGSGQFGGPGQTSISVPLGAFDDGDVGIADLDGDGDLDLVIAAGLRQSGPGLAIYLNSGGSLPSFTLSGTALFSGCRAVAIADLDGDGFLDIATESSGAVQVLKGNGTGSFSTQSTIPFFTTPSLSDTQYLRVADLIGNGTLLWAGSGQQGALVRLPNFILVNSAWTFRPIYPPAPAPGRLPQLAVLDFDNDGDLDIAHPVASASRGYVAIAINNGSAVFQQSQTFEVPTPTPGWVKAADTDGDGDDDLIVGGSLVSIIVNQN